MEKTRAICLMVQKCTYSAMSRVTYQPPRLIQFIEERELCSQSTSQNAIHQAHEEHKGKIASFGKRYGFNIEKMAEQTKKQCIACQVTGLKDARNTKNVVTSAMSLHSNIVVFQI